MKKLTYKEAYDKIIEAYFKDEIKPLDAKFCFCGNLCDNTSRWRIDWCPEEKHNDSHGYSGRELRRMEVALMHHPELMPFIHQEGTKEYEEGIFLGMCAALEVLKQIHKERGEDVDGVQEFTKRKLDKNNF